MFKVLQQVIYMIMVGSSSCFFASDSRPTKRARIEELSIYGEVLPKEHSHYGVHSPIFEFCDQMIALYSLEQQLLLKWKAFTDFSKERPGEFDLEIKNIEMQISNLRLNKAIKNIK